MSFLRYPKYKDSGVEWLGQVPEHWDICAVNYRYEVELGKMLDEKRITGNHLASYLRNTDVQWGRINTENLPQMDFAGDDLTRYGLKRGDLLVCEGGEVGRAAIWNAPLAECYYQKALHRIRPRDSDRDSAPFLCAIFASVASLGVFTSSGGKSTIAHLPAETLRRYRFPFPPLAEQTAIAEFLDRETEKIDELMTEQRRLMELLKEKRQAVISHAVTKGLNPDAPMKPSGIEWLGYVPAHWDVVPVAFRYNVQLGKMLDSTKITGEHLRPYLRVFDVQWGDINTDDLPLMDFDEHARSKFRLKSGDLLVNEGGSYPGRSAIWSGKIAECYYQKALHRMRPQRVEEDTTRFLFFVMSWAANQGVFVAGGNETTIEHLPAEKLRRYRFAFPSKAEQMEIASFLEAELTSFDTLTAEAQRGIDLLQERRSALISAAVTGQIDVRVAAGLKK